MTRVAKSPLVPRKYAVTVDFKIKADQFALFMPLIRENAEASLKSEPECFRFDILVTCDEAEHRVFLYEIYGSKAAFEAHLRAKHYLDFDRATAGMITSKSPKAFWLEYAFDDHK